MRSSLSDCISGLVCRTRAELWAIGLASALVGCSEPPPPAPIPAAEIPKTLEGAFSKASPEMRGVMTEATKALEGGEQSVALENLEALSRQPDLTPEQREAASRAALTVRGSILEAAKKGDAGAQAYLEQQRARK
jgi:hypothetical protein